MLCGEEVHVENQIGFGKLILVGVTFGAKEPKAQHYRECVTHTGDANDHSKEQAL